MRIEKRKFYEAWATRPVEEPSSESMGWSVLLRVSSGYLKLRSNGQPYHMFSGTGKIKIVRRNADGNIQTKGAGGFARSDATTNEKERIVSGEAIKIRS